MGFVLLNSDTPLPDCGVSVAPVTLTWKNRTATPPGGVSVIVIPTGTLPGNELEVSGGVEDWLPHPVINTTTATVERNNAALSILAS